MAGGPAPGPQDSTGVWTRTPEAPDVATGT